MDKEFSQKQDQEGPSLSGQVVPAPGNAVDGHF